MRSAVLVLFAAGAALAVSVGPAAVAAPVPKHLMKEEKRPAGLEGKWKLESARRGAKALQAPAGSTTMDFLNGKLITVSNVGQKDETTSTAILAHDPARRQFSATQHRDTGGQLVNPDVGYGYAIDGDTLTLATSQGPNRAFAPADPLKPGEDDVVIVLKRVKP